MTSGLSCSRWRKKDEITKARKVTIALHRLQDELAAAEFAVHQTGNWPKEDYEKEFETIRSVLNTAAIRDGWATYHDRLTPDVLKTLQLIGRRLPPDTDPAPSNDIDELLDLIRQLEESVRKCEQHDELRSFLFTLVDLMRRAVREYPYRGAKAFRHAAYDIRVAFEENPEAAAEAVGMQDSGPLKRAWTKFLQVGTKVERSYRVLKAGLGIVQILAGAASEHHLPLPDPEPPQFPSGSVEAPVPRTLA